MLKTHDTVFIAIPSFDLLSVRGLRGAAAGQAVQGDITGMTNIRLRLIYDEMFDYQHHSYVFLYQLWGSGCRQEDKYTVKEYGTSFRI